MALTVSPAASRKVAWESPSATAEAVEIKDRHWHLTIPGAVGPLILGETNIGAVQRIVTTVGRAYDEIARLEGVIASPEAAAPEPGETAYVVNSLGYDETDMVWVDCDGDYYRFHPKSDRWQFSFQNDGVWEDVELQYTLEIFYPYRAIGPRTPRKVTSLSEAERDADWEYINYSGDRFVYFWRDGTWWCDKGPNWEPVLIGVDGPLIVDDAGYLTEILLTQTT